MQSGAVFLLNTGSTASAAIVTFVSIVAAVADIAVIAMIVDIAATLLRFTLPTCVVFPIETPVATLFLVIITSLVALSNGNTR